MLSTKKDGDKLRPIEIFDIICYEAEAVYAGGIRRAALITFFDWDDEEMLSAKIDFTVLSYKEGSNTFYSSGELYQEYTVDYQDPAYGVKEGISCFLSEKNVSDMKEKNTLPWYFFQPQRSRSNNSAVLVRGEHGKKEFDHVWSKLQASNAGEPGFFWTNSRDQGANP